MIRPILSLKRLSIDKAKGKVCYQYGKDSSELEQMDYLEFIARVTSHISDKGQVMIRYYGLKIIAHLKLSFMSERPPPPQIVQQELLMAAEERGEYF